MPSKKGTEKYRRRLVRKKVVTREAERLKTLSRTDDVWRPPTIWVDQERRVLRSFCVRAGINPRVYDFERIYARTNTTLGDLTSGWLRLAPSQGRRPVMNRTALREICVAMKIPYWDKMTVREMRALLLLIADHEGLPDVDI